MLLNIILISYESYSWFYLFLNFFHSLEIYDINFVICEVNCSKFCESDFESMSTDKISLLEILVFFKEEQNSVHYSICTCRYL